MSVLSSFRQPDRSFVRLWNGLLEEKIEEMEELGFEIGEVSGMRDETCSLDFPPLRRRSWLRRVSEGEDNDVVLGLIIANAAVFLLWKIADTDFMVKNFINALINVRSGRLHTLITSAFSHIGTEHFIHNMIGLYVFGAHIERIFGPQFLLGLYLAGALGGSVFFLVHKTYLAVSSMGRREENKDPNNLALGAGGAVHAIILLDIFLFPKSISTPGFSKPLFLGIFLIGKDILRLILGDEQISGATQLGGAAVAAIAWTRLRKGRF
ncbi:RHOMBOID-like protein 12, mitochondrial [Prunus persica]|uniref:RHOMBOID-like protein 12, mitochondrial n=1 Tax=Prunus persica TaxID=3760 RepID=UPI0009AB5B35|nr:RHOMBOID-like protein 12, mitochondrial [Prunus persica]